MVDHRHSSAQIRLTHHCGRCQPHTVHTVACLACGDGPLLTGNLAELAHNTDSQRLPDIGHQRADPSRMALDNNTSRHRPAQLPAHRA